MKLGQLAVLGGALSALAWVSEAHDTSGNALRMRAHSSSALTRGQDLSSKLDMKSGKGMDDGEEHDHPDIPDGAKIITIPVDDSGAKMPLYWPEHTNDKKAKSAYVAIHGRKRDGNRYWEVMKNILESAVDNNYPGADKNAIVIAPQFYSRKLNKGLYDSDTLAWNDINTWEAGGVAAHPSGTKQTSFDAMDALLSFLSDKKRFPSMKNITLLGHGGGGQLVNRYAAVGDDPPNKKVHVRYVVGDPSSSPYFTADRPLTDSKVASRSTCQGYNSWRYGFDDFPGKATGKKSVKDYFGQYINRDVINIVGHADTAHNGDQKCMALLQGGHKRRDRNLSWWRYINMLARTGEVLDGFPGSFPNLPDWSDVSHNHIRTRLTIVKKASHDVEAVYNGEEGRSALFRDSDLNIGWRPHAWRQVVDKKQRQASSSSKASKKSSKASSSSKSSKASSSKSSNSKATSSKRSGDESLRNAQVSAQRKIGVKDNMASRSSAVGSHPFHLMTLTSVTLLGIWAFAVVL